MGPVSYVVESKKPYANKKKKDW